jgi:hypothetical protein
MFNVSQGGSNGIYGDGGSVYGGVNTKAVVTQDGEILTTESERELNAYASIGKMNVINSGWACLIDLTDTINYPHNQTGRIDLSYLTFQIDKDAIAAGNVSAGVITNINGTSAAVQFFGGISFNNVSAANITRVENFSPSQVKLGVSGGRAYRMASSTTSGITALNTGTRIDSYYGTGSVFPAIGDVVVQFARVSGSFNASARVLYHSHANI